MGNDFYNDYLQGGADADTFAYDFYSNYDSNDIDYRQGDQWAYYSSPSVTSTFRNWSLFGW